MCLASPQDPLPYLPAAPRPLKRPSLSQALPRANSSIHPALPGPHLPPKHHASQGDVRTHVPDSKETGRARDMRSRGAKEHSQKALAIHSLPLGQTLGSAAALSEESGHTRSSQWIPVLACGNTGQASQQPAGLWPSLLPLQRPHSAHWVEWRPDSREQACPLNPAQPQTHWGTWRRYTSCIPTIRNT